MAHKRLLCTELPQPEKPVSLSKTEAHHALHVMRLRVGDVVELMDGKGKKVFGKLRRSGETLYCDFEKIGIPLGAPKVSAAFKVNLEIAVLKGKAMEWVIEKAVEFGVDELTPVITARTVVEMRHKGFDLFLERWGKIADQSLKQCGRLERIQIHTPKTLEELLSPSQRSEADKKEICLWCDEAEATEGQALYLGDWLYSAPQDYSKVNVLIGPEGGWAPQERERLKSAGSGIVQVQLGSLILRAESAAIFASALVTAKGHLTTNSAHYKAPNK